MNRIGSLENTMEKSGNARKLAFSSVEETDFSSLRSTFQSQNSHPRIRLALDALTRTWRTIITFIAVPGLSAHNIYAAHSREFSPTWVVVRRTTHTLPHNGNGLTPRQEMWGSA